MTMPLDDRFYEVLDQFQRQADQDVVLHLSSHSALLMVMAWKQVAREEVDFFQKPPRDERARWEWLWKHIEFEVLDWARVACVSIQKATAISRSLIANRVVFPDGKINSFAQAYLDYKSGAMLKDERKQGDNNDLDEELD